MHRAPFTVAAALVLVLVASAPVSAATLEVQAQGSAFQPAIVRLAAPGDAVRWRNLDPWSHTSAGNAPLRHWSSPTIASGQTYTKVFIAAGIYPYFCQFHPGMEGSVRVPVRPSPTTGTAATTFTITWASVVAPSGYRYQVQRRAPAATTWSAYRTTTARLSTFKTSIAGNWQFRGRLQRLVDGIWVSSSWSAARKVTVNPG